MLCATHSPAHVWYRSTFRLLGEAPLGEPEHAAPPPSSHAPAGLMKRCQRARTRRGRKSWTDSALWKRARSEDKVGRSREKRSWCRAAPRLSAFYSLLSLWSRCVVALHTSGDHMPVKECKTPRWFSLKFLLRRRGVLRKSLRSCFHCSPFSLSHNVLVVKHEYVLF